jgi:hypothetical protein
MKYLSFSINSFAVGYFNRLKYIQEITLESQNSTDFTKGCTTEVTWISLKLKNNGYN